MTRGRKEVGMITKHCGCGYSNKSTSAWFDHVKKVHGGGRRVRNKKIRLHRRRWRPKAWKSGKKPRRPSIKDDYL